MSTILDTDANDPRLNLEEGPTPEVGVVRPDFNVSDLPDGYEYSAYPEIDNNADAGVALDLNANRPKSPQPIETDLEAVKKGNETARKEIEEYEVDPEDDWIGLRRGADAIDLPQSRYLSPDLSFKDPPDLELDYEAEGEKLDLPLRPRLREPL